MALFYWSTDQVSVASIFVGVMPLLELKILQNTQFFALSSCMLWHLELKSCIFLCFTVLQTKSECHQFASIFVGSMPLLELRILEVHIFRTFLLHALAYWAKILHMTLFYCTTDQVRMSTIWVFFCWSYAPFGTNTQFSALFFYVLWHIELKCSHITLFNVL